MSAQNANHTQARSEMHMSPLKVHWMLSYLIKKLLVAKENEGLSPCLYQDIASHLMPIPFSSYNQNLFLDKLASLWSA
jgi:hypothetical protein